MKLHVRKSAQILLSTMNEIIGNFLKSVLNGSILSYQEFEDFQACVSKY